MPLANLWFICLQGYFPILRTRSCHDLYLLICPPKRPLTDGKGRILIPGFIRSPPMLADYYVAHSILLRGVNRDFPCIEDETWRHFSYLSGILFKIIQTTYSLYSGHCWDINEVTSVPVNDVCYGTRQNIWKKLKYPDYYGWIAWNAIF